MNEQQIDSAVLPLAANDRRSPIQWRLTISHRQTAKPTVSHWRYTLSDLTSQVAWRKRNVQLLLKPQEMLAQSKARN